MDLQPEIRCRILEFTDLITPVAHVIWCLGGFDARGKSDSRHGDCFKPLATNWAPPTAMFLVSHYFSAIAHSVFLSRNYFEVCDCETKEVMENVVDLWDDPFPKMLDVSHAAGFLSRPLASNYLSYITALEINPRRWGPQMVGSNMLRQWQDAVECVNSCFNPRRLIISIGSDCSVPIYQELLLAGNSMEFPWPFLSQDGIDTVRQSVDMVWPIHRLAQSDGVKMFLWDFQLQEERIIYYCRHRSEPLPEVVGDMVLSRLHRFGEIHIQRSFRSPAASGTRTSNQSANSGWIEGLFGRTHSEDDEWYRNGLNPRSWLPCSPSMFSPKLPSYCTSAATFPDWKWEKEILPMDHVSQSLD